MEVKILVYKNPAGLEKEIKYYCENYPLKLLGPVSTGTNGQGNMVLVATLVSPEEEE